MKQLYSIILCLAMLLPGLIMAAPDGQFTGSVDNDHVATGEQFTVTFTLSGQGGSGFRPPAFNDFMVLSGPNTSMNMQIINGAVSSAVSYSYVLQPRSEGKFTIGPATIDYGGKHLQTAPIVITVTKGAPPARQNGQGGGGGEDNNISRQISQNLMIKVLVDHTSAYQGQQITVAYKLYNRVSLANGQISKLPANSGFWSEDLAVPKGATREVVNGKQWEVQTLKKVALFPQRTGTLTIDPMELECLVQVQQRRQMNNPFDQFFNDPFFGGVQNVKHVVRSEPVKITVQPLPTAAGVEGFTGAVGKFTMESWLDKNATKTNEPVTLKIKIVGRGNLKLLEAPQINFPADFDKYDPKMSDNISSDGNTISGSRTFEYLLIPRHPGEQKIPAFAFSYFDVEKKQYVTTHSHEFTVTVDRGSDMAASGVSSGISKEDVKLLGEDIRFIKSGNTGLRRQGEGLAGSIVFYAATATPFLAFIGFIAFMRKRERALGDVRAVRNRRAQKIARKRLEESKKFLLAKKREEFYGAISRALWGYASDKLNIPASDLTTDNIEAGFRARNIAPELLEQLRKTVEECEFARFAPAAGSEQMDAMYASTVNLISEIEEKAR